MRNRGATLWEANRPPGRRRTKEVPAVGAVGLIECTSHERCAFVSVACCGADSPKPAMKHATASTVSKRRVMANRRRDSIRCQRSDKKRGGSKDPPLRGRVEAGLQARLLSNA